MRTMRRRFGRSPICWERLEADGEFKQVNRLRLTNGKGSESWQLMGETTSS